MAYLDGYVDVPTRLRMALKDWPQLRIQETSCTTEQHGEQTFLVCVITVWRDERDAVPVIASAAEPIPGRTPYTRLSERMVGFTSALGRALGYMGYGIDKSIASANEVEARQPADDDKMSDRQRFANARSQQIVAEQQQKRAMTTSGAPATAPQMKMLKIKAKQAKVDNDNDLLQLCQTMFGDAVTIATLTKQQASMLIDKLSEMHEAMLPKGPIGETEEPF
jgi:hypothetical protein